MGVGRVILFLVGVGLVRSVLDIPWLYWELGSLPLLGPNLDQPAWYGLNVGPYVLSVVIATLLRWVLFASLVHSLARFLGSDGSYRVTLDFYGAVLGITVFTILIDYAHFFFEIPLIRFEAAPRYHLVIGLGQVATAAWIGCLTFLLARRDYRLAALPAAMVGCFIPLLNTGLFLIVAGIYFRLAPAEISVSDLLVKFKFGFVAVCLGAFVALLWWSRRLVATQSSESAKRIGRDHSLYSLSKAAKTQRS